MFLLYLYFNRKLEEPKTTTSNGGTHVKVECKWCLNWERYLDKSQPRVINALNGHKKACQAKRGHIVEYEDVDSSGQGVERVKACGGGGDEQDPTEEGVAYYKDCWEGGTDDCGEDFTDDFVMEEVHMTETHCFKFVALPEMPQQPTETVIAELEAFAGGDIPVEVKATPAPRDSSHVTYAELMAKSDKRMFDHQQKTIRLLEAPAMMKKDKNLSLVLSVYTMGLSLGVSDRKGDILLRGLSMVHKRALAGSSSTFGAEGDESGKAMQEECEEDLVDDDDNAVDTSGLHQHWKSLRVSIEKGLMRLNPVQVMKIPLPPKLFPAKGLDKQDLRPVLTNHFNILDRIADACLDINANQFFFAPKPEFVKDDPSQRLFSNFSTGKLYEREHLCTTQAHGPHAVSVMLAAFSDKAAAGKKREADPLLIWVLNAFGESYTPIFLGFCPTRLPYTDAYLNALLDKSGEKKPTKEAKKFAIRFAKRQAKLQYLRAVLAPLKEYEDTGFKLQIGTGYCCYC